MSRARDSVAINPAALRTIRRARGVGVTALATDVGVTASYVSNLEAGRRSAVSPGVFVALCLALRIDDQRALMVAPLSATPRDPAAA